MQQKINILVVEDDNDINQMLCKIIKKSKYYAIPAYSGTEALLYLENKQWDLVLLDLMLPGISGKEVLKQVREHSSTPVIIISAKNESQYKITSLRMGADDYISKPFDIEEVAARIDALLRRYQKSEREKNTSNQELVFKDIVLNIDSQKVIVNNFEVTLTLREFKILQLLMENPQKIYSKANLFETVWEEKFYGDENTVNVHMSNLRNKLAQNNATETYIETIWGIGYRLKS
ncbi:response regulator transcription factor [Staphylococcus saprophyticus]|uniref:response regulator transcription factor n=1 Tax=Staphylococcus TaxID=1279 RepID=UPI0007B54CE6|nr:MULTISPECIES: response regulator transcription factor [Staphylococcus]HCV7682766.1 response regulator transcription factor [Staphylococcus aureus]MDW3956054.1 response regulator transcription factor [Staphylococcus saprophyticus]MDW4194670.1 response regulator transcription factor [Staphylococcus saprophyticus]MDW4219333.1 response regulator transcription factor [Staphylococcus saprophyticus]MDW4251516.1 response regulator transcription factor [Staphylococcus saprophyticus]